MPLRVNGRGFVVVTFNDRYDIPCSLQESSLANEAAVWLGVDDVEGEPARMHLSQEQVKTLLPLLQHFVDTGRLPREMP